MVKGKKIDFVRKTEQHVLENSRDQSTSYPALGKVETWSYVVMWLATYLTATTQVFYVSSNTDTRVKFFKEENLKVQQHFLTSRLLYDSSDFEWETWNEKFWVTVVYAYSAHFVIMRFGEQVSIKHRFHVSMIFCLLFGWYYFGLFPTVLLVLQSFIIYVVAYVSHKVALCWITSISFIFLFNNAYVTDTLNHVTVSAKNEVKYAMFEENPFLLRTYTCTSSMNILRCSAFAIEMCWLKQQCLLEKAQQASLKNKRNHPTGRSSNQLGFMSSFVQLLLYQFYFPLFTGGPIINYDDFKKQMEQKSPVTWTIEFSTKFILGLMRYVFWHCFLNAMLYFLLFSSVNTDLKLSDRLPLLTLCGLLLCSGKFFCMKYMVFYGLPLQYAISDNVNVPAVPRCISSYHKFTDIWKHFDRGLYKWLVRYVYIPIGGSRDRSGYVKQIFNSVIPFAFVLTWHGTSKTYAVWAGINWLGVVVEKLAADLYATKQVRQFEDFYLTPEWSRRLRASIKTLLFGILMISNLYFVGGYDIATLYMRRLYTEDTLSTVIIHVLLYFGVQTSMELNRRGY